MYWGAIYVAGDVLLVLTAIDGVKVICLSVEITIAIGLKVDDTSSFIVLPELGTRSRLQPLFVVVNRFQRPEKVIRNSNPADYTLKFADDHIENGQPRVIFSIHVRDCGQRVRNTQDVREVRGIVTRECSLYPLMCP